VEPRRAPREICWQGKLYVIADVPMGVCRQCGERFIKPDVAKALDRLLASGTPSRTMEVPVLNFGSDAA